MFKRFMTWLKKIFNIKNEPNLDLKIEIPSYQDTLTKFTQTDISIPSAVNLTASNHPINSFTHEQLVAITEAYQPSPLLGLEHLISSTTNTHINVEVAEVPHQPGPNGWSFFVPHPEPAAEPNSFINDHRMVAGS